MSLFVMIGVAFAGPVDANKAAVVAQKFVRANIPNANGFELVYTAQNGTDNLYYVFTTGEKGFVIVSANDATHPIFAYSETSTFDPQNIIGGAGYFLNKYKEQVEYYFKNDLYATPEIAREWANVEEYGSVNADTRAKKVGPLLQTLWDQNDPYNYKCPADAAGPGGHVYSGCVASSMSQIMYFWKHPIKGTGSHSYKPSGYPTQTVNFGATTYMWDNMPLSLTTASPVSQIDAVATLQYHCGVAVDMKYGAGGSGAKQGDIPNALKTYFGYASDNVVYRADYPADKFHKMLRDNFDCGFPAQYSGNDPTVEQGGHAFVCDGYDKNDLFHFNFGWSGYLDSWYLLPDIQFCEFDGAILNIIPNTIDKKVAEGPTSFYVTPDSETALSGGVSLKAPAKAHDGSTISAIEKIVVERNGKFVGEILNPTPGTTVTLRDENVPCFDVYEYTAYAVVDGVHGLISRIEGINYGPSCKWNFIVVATSFSGWGGSSLTLVNQAGTEFATITTKNTGTTTQAVDMPRGRVKLNFQCGTTITNIKFIVKDNDSNTVFSFDGKADEIPEGLVTVLNNSCGASGTMETPKNLYATTDGTTISVTWNTVANPGLGYNVYKDGFLYYLTTNNSFTDTDCELGGHCYQVTTIGDAGESELSNQGCATVGEGCNAGSDFYYEVTANLKPKMMWTKPNPSTGLTGYMLYRRTANTDYVLIKQIGASATTYTDNSGMVEGETYYYKLVAYYRQIECYSAPAGVKGDDQAFELKFKYSLEGLEEFDAKEVNIYPNPTNGILNIKAENINRVEIFNLVGQKIYNVDLNRDEFSIDMNQYGNGLYLVRISANGVETTKRVVVE